MILLCNERKRPCIAAPSPNDDRPLESAGWKDSVEAYWPPLTPEHGFPSLSYKVQGAPPQPAAGIPRLLFSHPFLQKAQKNRRHLHRMPPEKVPISTTSSGGIIRIRFKGRRSTFLSACHTSSPVYSVSAIIAFQFLLCKWRPQENLIGISAF